MARRNEHIQLDSKSAPAGRRFVGRALLVLGGAVLGALAAARVRRRRAVAHETALAPDGSFESRVPIRRATGLPQSEATCVRRAHEPSEVNLLAIGLILALLALAAFVIHTSLWQMAKSAGPPSLDSATRWQPVWPGLPKSPREVPQLQLSPRRDLEQFRANEERELHRAGASAGTAPAARIPIEEAMGIVARRGAPRWREAGEQAKAVTPLQLQQSRAAERKPNEHD